MILPDTKSSPRWETADRPELEAAFKEAGVEYDIQNAQGDAQKMQTIAEQMITSGVTVLAIVNLDNASGAAIEQKAKEQGVADHRLRPADPGRLGRLLRLVRQHQGRRAPGPGPAEVPRRQAREHRLPQRLARRQQRHAVLAGCALGARQGRPTTRRSPSRPCPSGTTSRPQHDLRADVHPGRRQDRRRARGQRRAWPTRRSQTSSKNNRQGPGDRSGRDRRRACRTSSPATSA